MFLAKLEGLVETGIVQYFHHSPSSRLPVRDALNELGQGFKTEPHIERKAENYVKPCYQTNLRRFASSDGKYLFLITTVRNRELEQYGNQYVVGIIEKENILERPSPNGRKHLAVVGKTALYHFADSLLVKDIFEGKNFTRPLLLHSSGVDYIKTRIILDHFSAKENIFDECLKELKKLKRKLKVKK